MTKHMILYVGLAVSASTLFVHYLLAGDAGAALAELAAAGFYAQLAAAGRGGGGG